MDTRYPPLPIGDQVVRLAWEQDAAHAKLPKPATAAFWRFLSIERGERAIREAPTRGARTGEGAP